MSTGTHRADRGGEGAPPANNFDVCEGDFVAAGTLRYTLALSATRMQIYELFGLGEARFVWTGTAAGRAEVLCALERGGPLPALAHALF